MRSKSLQLFFAPFLAMSLCASLSASAAGKKRPTQPAAPSIPQRDGKRVIALAPVERVRIELPDQTFRDFGADFQARMVTRLTQSGKFVIADPIETTQVRVAGLNDRLRSAPDPYVWPGTYVPAATVKVHVDALSMRAGGRGTRMLYGFDERTRNSFNDGSGTKANEFPLRTTLASQPGWFGESFASRGDWLTGSRSGLDLGDGFDLNLLFVWFSVKYAQYHSALRLRVEIDAPLAGRHDVRQVAVEGKGYYYDIVGGYHGFSAGIRVAHRDAMIQAFERSIDASIGAIERSVEGLPLTAVIDKVDADGRIFLGTGQSAEVLAGTRYEPAEPNSDFNKAILEVEASMQSGAVAHLIQGDASRLRPGQILKQAGYENANDRRIASLSQASVSAEAVRLPGVLPLVATESIQLPDTTLARPDLGGYVQEVSTIEAFFRSLAGTFTLPYRIWRYHQYDRKFAESADDLSVVPPGARNQGPIVAVIDSGVDYNHPVIHPALWLNPTPWTDPAGQTDRYGWDFISGDSRPADDHFHGTRVASAVLAANPDARIMALKAFNPWGITSSAAIYAAFRYAVEHGAQVIVCAWGTTRPSEALTRGIALAQDAHIPVVTAGRNRFLYPAALAPEFDNIVLALPTGPGHPSELTVSEPRLGQVSVSAQTASSIEADPWTGYIAGTLSR